MEKCPECNFKKIRERTIRDANGTPVETGSICKNCGHVVRRTKIEVK